MAGASSSWNMWTSPHINSMGNLASNSEREPRNDSAYSADQEKSNMDDCNAPGGPESDGSAINDFDSGRLHSASTGFRSSMRRPPPSSYHSYFMYLGEGKLDLNEDVCFYLESTNLCFPLPQRVRLNVSVSTLTGTDIAVKFAVDRFRANRYVGSFKLEPRSTHFISVRTGYGRNRHVKGSPIRIAEADYLPKSNERKQYRLLKDIRSGWAPSLDDLPYVIKYEPGPKKPLQDFRPTGIAMHPESQSIYVTDSASHEVIRYKYSFLDRIITLNSRFGCFGTETSCFRQPSGVAVDNMNHRLVIADKGNNRISIFGLDGQFILSFGQRGKGDGEFMNPQDVAVSPDGNFIAVADSLNQRVQLFNGIGVYLRQCYVLGELEEGVHKKKMPRHITFKNSGGVILITSFGCWTIFACDIFMDKKLVMTPDGLQKCYPRGIAMNELGHVLVAEKSSNSIKVISEYVKLLPDILQDGDEPFHQPIDVVTAPAGLICVLEASGTIRLFQLKY